MVDPSPASANADGLTWSGPIGLALRPIRVVPDLRVGTRRAASPLRGEVRPQKRFCPLRTCSPHSKLSRPHLEAWRAERVHPHFSSVWQLGDASVFPLLQSVLSLPAGRVCGDTVGSPLQRSDPVPATCQSSTSLSINPDKDAEGSPSWRRVPLLPGLRHPISGMSSFSRHSASSIAFHSRMGASTGGIALGSPHDSVRLHTSVWEKSPPLRQGSTDGSKQHLQGFCSIARAFLPPTERSDRGNTAVGHRTRVLQALIPRSKEGRRSEAHSGSTAFEFFPLQREVQDADDENHHVSD